MKRKIIFALAALLAWALPALSETRITAISVGKGDAILVEIGDYTCLIDGGRPEAMGRIKRAFRELGIKRLDAVFLTHVDNDHAGGMAWLAESGMEIGAWYASDFYFEYKEKKHPLVKAGAHVTWLRAGDAVPAGEGARFSVLGPVQKSESEENDNSLVLLLESPDGRALFTGDMELPAERDLLATGADLSCQILKVSNHGDGDATGPDFVLAAAPQISLISTDSYQKPGTPDMGVMARLEGAGSAVYITQNASAIRATLVGGKAAADYLHWPDEAREGITLAVEREGELFRIANAGGEAIDLAGWYLHSDRGNEMHLFDGGQILPGETLVVGTRSSPAGRYSILWDEKNVLANKKDDPVGLYDQNGALIAYAP